MEYKLRTAVNLLGRPVSYYSVFTRICGGNANAGIFLSNFYYWEGKQEDPDGWIHKTQREIERETGLNRYGQESARKILKQLFLMQEQRKGVPAKLHFLFDWDAVDQLIVNFAESSTKGKAAVKSAKKRSRKKAGEDPAEIRSTNMCYPSLVVFEEFYNVWMNRECETTDKRYLYTWTGKEKGQLKNLVNAFRDRLVKKKEIAGQDPIDAENMPEAVAEQAIRPFMETYLEMSLTGQWNMKVFSAANFVTHLADILSKMEIYVKQKRQGVLQQPAGKTASQDNRRTKGHSFTSDHAETIQRITSWGEDS